MILNVPLPPELAARLVILSGTSGATPAEVAAEVLAHHLPAEQTPKRREVLAALLDSWIVADTEETGQDGEAFLKGLDANRGESERKLFPPELRGVTW